MLSMLAGFVALYLSSVDALFQGRQPFPFIKPFDAITSFVIMIAGAVSFFYAWSASEEATKQLPKPHRVVTWLFFTLLLGIGLLAAFSQVNTVSGHPIDLLIANGREQHDNLLAQANSSSTLQEAVKEYQRRYKMPPPP